MNPLRESYLITENEHNFDSLFAKINLYNYQRVHSRGRLNESRFNAKNDIRLTLSEQQCVKDFFKIVEYKMLQSYENRMNEGIDFNIGAKVKKIKQFFEALSKMVIGTVSEFINKIIEMLNKLGQKVSEFIDSVFGFDGFDNFKPKDQGGILKGIDSKQLGFIGAVQEYCSNNLKSPEIKSAAKELGSVNEGFSDKLDNWLKNSKMLNSKVGKLILGDRSKVGGGKVSLWKTIGVSIVGSLLLCTVIPMLVSPLGTVGVCITVACKVVWVSRGVIKVLHHRSKTKTSEQSLWNFWTVFQIILVVGTPILFAIPGVKDAVNGWMADRIKDLGLDKYTDKIAQFFKSGTTESRTVIKEINDPDVAKNAILGKDAVAGAVMDRADSFRAIHNAGGDVFDYIKKVTSDIGLDGSDAKSMTNFMTDFNKLDIKGPDVYDHVFGKLQDCKTMQIGFDTSIVKRTFGDTKTFVNVLFDKFKEEGINVNKAKFYNLINQAAWENSSGNRGAIDVISLPDVKSSAENVEAINKVLKDVLGDSTVSKGHTVIGVLNAPMKFTKTVKEIITSFNPKWNFGLLYMPIFKKGLILHNELTNKDYQINNIKQDVPLSEFKPLLNNQAAKKMVDKEKEIIDAQYEEIEESLKQLEWERLFETDNLPAVINKGNTLPAVVNKGNTLPAVVNKGNTLPAVVNKGNTLPAVVNKGNTLPATTNKGNTLPAVVNNNGGGLPTTTGNNLPVPVGNREVVLKQQGEIIKREQKELQAYQQGDVNCTVFYSPAVDNQMAMAFSSPFNVVCVNPKVAENNENGVDRPLFKKGLFKFYTFKTDKSNQKEFTEYLRKQMKDSVMKTYEIIKFAALNYQILKEEDGKLMVGDKAQNTSIPALGNFTPQEFCDIFNGDKDAYEFYKAEYAGGSTSTESQQPQNGQENGQENTQQTSQQNSQENTQQRNLPSPNQSQQQSGQNQGNSQSNQNQTTQPQNNGGNNVTNNNTQTNQQQSSNGSDTQSQSNQQQPKSNNNTNQQNKQGNGKKSLKWYQKFCNWIKSKKNESFNFDDKMSVEELYETLATVHKLRKEGLIHD